MMVYASSEVHSSVQKAVELVGLGSESLRLIPTNDEFQIDINTLETVIEHDRANGHEPFCMIGCAGTVNTGAFDDLEQLANICQRENLWFHVDGAFGALAVLLAEILSPIEKEDAPCWGTPS
jgi:glutamate/tyrosine decarboxylase-like PLP-dependent enzyme